MTTENDLAKSLDNLPEDFDYSNPAALAAAMGYEDDADDGEDSNQGESTETQAVQAPAPSATPAPAKTEQSDATPGAAATEPVEVVGVQTKDGKHTLPYAVLQEARRNAALNKQRADELTAEKAKLEQQIEAMKSGKPADDMSADELEKLAEDFPQLAPVLKTVKDLQAKVATQGPAQADPASRIDQELDAQAELDNALASRPLLSKYQQQGGVVWGRAVEIDQALMQNPAFAAKPLAERFAEVERQLAGELGIQQASTPKPTTVDPKAIQNAPRVGPSTLSDIAGTAPKVEQDPWDDRTPLDGLAAAEKLSDEGLMRLAGLSY